MEPEYGVLRPTLRGGEADTLDFHELPKYNTRQWAEREVAAWRSRGERAHVVIREWKLRDEMETQPANSPLIGGQCAWCDSYARGSAYFPGHGQTSTGWYPSCGRLLHGFQFEPSMRWRDS